MEQRANSLTQYECCAFIIDTWVESVAQGRSNVAPAKFPWDLLRTLIAEMYGGKVDNQGDFEQLKRVVNEVVDPAAYELDHRLVQPRENDDGLRVPSGNYPARLHDLGGQAARKRATNIPWIASECRETASR